MIRHLDLIQLSYVIGNLNMQSDDELIHIKWDFLNTAY